MTDTAYRIPRHSVGLTIFLLMAGATLGAVWGLFLSSFIATASLAAGGPLALLIAGPLLFAIYGVGTTYIVFGAPLWALFGGMWFAASASRDTGSAATQMGVTFFSKSHPINQATQRMAQQLDLPPVRYVGWFGSDDINAFAMGTSNRYALVAVSKGAIENLSQEQLDAVIAHELGHIASNDMERMTYALGVRESLTFFLIFRGLKKFARWVFTPLSELELLRFSRAREFTADAISAHLTSSEAMISVLEKLKGEDIEPRTHQQPTVMMSASFDGSWFSTHPPLDARIAALDRRINTGPNLSLLVQGEPLSKSKSMNTEGNFMLIMAHVHVMFILEILKNHLYLVFRYGGLNDRCSLATLMAILKGSRKGAFHAF